MPKWMRKQLNINGRIVYCRKRIRGRNSCSIELRYRRDGYNISVSGPDIETVKERFIKKRESGGPLSLWKLSECIPVSKRTGERQADRPQLAGLYRAFIRLHGFHWKAVPEPCSHHHQLGATGQSPFPAKIL